MTTITKKELIDRIAKDTQAKRITVKRIVQTLLRHIDRRADEGQPPGVPRLRRIRDKDPRIARCAESQDIAASGSARQNDCKVQDGPTDER